MIAFDIDGVLTDFANEVYIPTLNQVCGTTIPSGYRCDEWGFVGQICTAEQDKEVWESPVLLTRMEQARPLEKGLALARACAPHAVFITSRGVSDPEPLRAEKERITRRWLTELGLTAPVFFVRSGGKADHALAAGITVAYEDHPRTILQYAGKNILCFTPRYGYNRHVKHQNIVFMDGWEDAL